MKQTETSSDSELNDISPRRRQQHRHHRGDPDLYYEERWIERRTRRRANRRRLSRQDSRSFSEEELRHSKSSSKGPKGTDRHRRALSENARYDETNNGASDVEAEQEGEDDGRGMTLLVLYNLYNPSDDRSIIDEKFFLYTRERE